VGWGGVSAAGERAGACAAGDHAAAVADRAGGGGVHLGGGGAGRGADGAVPAAIAAIFDLLSAEEALAARITWATMTEVYREDPLIAAIVAAGVATSEQVDALFRAAARV
jgi:hypothetical protein